LVPFSKTWRTIRYGTLFPACSSSTVLQEKYISISNTREFCEHLLERPDIVQEFLQGATSLVPRIKEIMMLKYEQTFTPASIQNIQVSYFPCRVRLTLNFKAMSKEAGLPNNKRGRKPDQLTAFLKYIFSTPEELVIHRSAEENSKKQGVPFMI
jgi:hypothetical protein